MSTPQLASVDHLFAFQSGTSLFIVARGSKPTPCYRVSIVRRPERPIPSIYEVQMVNTDLVCAEVVTAYEVFGRFLEVADAEAITVLIAEGPRQVEVHQLGDAIPPAGAIGLNLVHAFVDSLAQEGDNAKSSAEAVAEFVAPPRDAIGYSAAMSFDEALADALRNLPTANVGGSAMFERIIVEEIGVESGGIVGITRLFVRVRG